MAMTRWAVAVAVVLAMSTVVAGAGTDCSEALGSVTGCSSYITNPSSTPDTKECCEPLQKVLTTASSFQCLCAQASSSNSDLFKNALNLPKACKLDINVSEANCTSSSSTTPSTTPSTGTPTSSSATTPGSSGFLSALPYPPFIMAMALLCAAASLLL